jgi:nucleolar pre-ribosomal-associated protein 1
VLKKCAKLPVLAQHLVKDCGLLSWISSVISSHDEGLGTVSNFSPGIVGLALEVSHDLKLSQLWCTPFLEATIEYMFFIFLPNLICYI